MRKIPTLFVRDPDDLRRVTAEVHPDCQWVLDGEGTPTRKFDGSCVGLGVDGSWWARRELKPGKQPPDNFDPEEYDETTGKTVGWEPIEQSGFAKFLTEALEKGGAPSMPDTYELCGPKINGNPEGYDRHTLVQHGTVPLPDAPRDYDALRPWLAGHSYEGIVWHHPDGWMAKLKKKDFPDG